MITAYSSVASGAQLERPAAAKPERRPVGERPTTLLLLGDKTMWPIGVFFSCLLHLLVIWYLGVPFWIALGFIGAVGSALAMIFYVDKQLEPGR